MLLIGLLINLSLLHTGNNTLIFNGYTHNFFNYSIVREQLRTDFTKAFLEISKNFPLHSPFFFPRSVISLISFLRLKAEGFRGGSVLDYRTLLSNTLETKFCLFHFA